MAKYKSLAAETLWVDVAGRSTKVDPGEVVDIPDDVYAQTGEHGEPALYEPVDTKTTRKKEQG